MPELPEVETVCRGLAQHLINASITRVQTRRKDLRQPLPAALQQTLTGRTVRSITRRAKYILMHFDKSIVLIAHLGMSGKMVLSKKFSDTYDKHDHVIIDWSNGYRFIFNDARRFGLMVLSREEELASHPLFADLGPEPLDNNFNGKRLFELLSGSRAPVKSVIMDQHKLVGVGNIYASEALFRAAIHPARSADSVARKEADKLAAAIREVLTDAIASGGSTLRDYVRSSGDSGYFQHHFRVYDRESEPCVVCKTPIQLMRQSGRSTYFCTQCQKKASRRPNHSRA